MDIYMRKTERQMTVIPSLHFTFMWQYQFQGALHSASFYPHFLERELGKTLLYPLRKWRDSW